jgi:type I restriction enzyme, S subunit
VSAELLLRELDRVAGVPGAVELLRAAIVELALRGELTTDARDQALRQPISSAEIASGMKALLAERPGYRWKASKARSSPLSEQIPDGWTLASLNDTGLFINGIAFKPTDWETDGRPIIRIQNLSGNNPDYNFTRREVSLDNIVKEGDLLVSWSATLDTYVWRGEDGVLNQHIFKVISNSAAVTKNFLYWLLKHEVRQLAKSPHAHGLAMMHINRGPFLSHPVLLPPHAEQDLIVQRVSDSMALCDELESAHIDRESRRDLLRTTSLRKLDEPDGLKEHAQFLVGHSRRMISKPEDVVGVRQAILSLAVGGRLVVQDPRDTPATDLLAANDRNRAAVALVDRRAESLPQSLLAAELRWAVPATWTWRGLADLALFIDYRGKTPAKVEQGIRLITAKNVRPGRINLHPAEFISDAEYHRWMTRGLPVVSDVLFTTEAPMGMRRVSTFRSRLRWPSGSST